MVYIIEKYTGVNGSIPTYMSRAGCYGNKDNKLEKLNHVTNEHLWLSYENQSQNVVYNTKT